MRRDGSSSFCCCRTLCPLGWSRWCWGCWVRWLHSCGCLGVSAGARLIAATSCASVAASFASVAASCASMLANRACWLVFLPSCVAAGCSWAAHGGAGRPWLLGHPRLCGLRCCNLFFFLHSRAFSARAESCAAALLVSHAATPPAAFSRSAGTSMQAHVLAGGPACPGMYSVFSAPQPRDQSMQTGIGQSSSPGGLSSQSKSSSSFRYSSSSSKSPGSSGSSRSPGSSGSSSSAGSSKFPGSPGSSGYWTNTALITANCSSSLSGSFAGLSMVAM